MNPLGMLVINNLLSISTLIRAPPSLSWIIRGVGRVTSDLHLTGLRPTENPLSPQGRSVNGVIQFTKPNSIVNLRGYYSNKRNGIGSIAPPIPAPCTKVMKSNVIIWSHINCVKLFHFPKLKPLILLSFRALFVRLFKHNILYKMLCYKNGKNTNITAFYPLYLTI